MNRDLGSLYVPDIASCTTLFVFALLFAAWVMQAYSFAVARTHLLQHVPVCVQSQLFQTEHRSPDCVSTGQGLVLSSAVSVSQD